MASGHDLFRLEVVRVAELIDWSVIEREFSRRFVSTTRHLVLLNGLVAERLYLGHTFALRDEEVVERWVWNLYWR